ncbi:MAG TPA: tetratricopeptide repeat protein [Candidatus Acidoferrum sp.]|nr:tetratricopeptide repeat protein [Candidatus Acidoferrum sp.]
MSDIIREVDEELRRENFEKLWRKYGSYALGLAALIIVGVAAYFQWQHYTAGQREGRARQYEAALALVTAADPGAPAALQTIANGDDGYAALAELQEAALKAKTGDTAGAVAIYEKMTADSAMDQSMRNLALILLALHTADTAPPDQLTQRLQPLTAATNPWRFSALELTAVLARRAGDNAKAEQTLTGLADDLNAPQALRQRVTEMLHALKG